MFLSYFFRIFAELKHIDMAFNPDKFTGIIENAISSIQYPSVAPLLFDPIRYTMESGGKRLRPTLTLAVYEALSHRDASEAVNQALAIELFHNFTLLHDDVMDRADIRRGRPTVHCKWNDNVAILSGDTMLTLASVYLCKGAGTHLAELSDCFNSTAMEVYEGQQLDMEFENRSDVSVGEYMEMIRLKTSVLLAGACKLGAIMACASKEECDRFYEYGEALGLAFQLLDDWLDTFGDPAVFGKEIGGDIINRKKTWLLITGLSEAPDELSSILDEDLENDELIRQVRHVYERLHLDRRCNELAEKYSLKALESLSNLNMDVDARKFFENLARQASTRSH